MERKEKNTVDQLSSKSKKEKYILYRENLSVKSNTEQKAKVKINTCNKEIVNDICTHVRHIFHRYKGIIYEPI